MFHLLLELTEGERHRDLTFAYTGEEDRDLAPMVSGLIEGDHEMIVLVLVPKEFELRAQVNILTPNP